jgi:hypothetical protein
MVRLVPALLLLLASASLYGADAKLAAGTGLTPTASAPATATAQVFSDAPISTSPAFEQNHPVEDFFTVTIISMPFTAFWSAIGAAIVAGIAQKKFPPNFDTPTLIGAGCVAAGASVTIGIVSAYWGQGKTPSRDQSPLPTKE